MKFNLDLVKQAQEVSFSRKDQVINHPPLFFNQNTLYWIPYFSMQTSLNKNSGLFLESKSKFIKHLQTIFQKTSKNIGLLHQLQIFLLICPLIAIHKSNGDIIHDETFNMTFQLKWRAFSVMQIY